MKRGVADEADRAVAQTIRWYLTAAAAVCDEGDFIDCMTVVLSTALAGCAIGFNRLGKCDLEVVLRVLEVARANEKVFLETEAGRRAN